MEKTFCIINRLIFYSGKAFTLIIVCIFGSLVVSAQSLGIQVDKQRLQIGEAVEIRLVVPQISKDSVVYVDFFKIKNLDFDSTQVLSDSFADVEILKMDPKDLYLDNGILRIDQSLQGKQITLTIAIFSLGSFELAIGDQMQVFSVVDDSGITTDTTERIREIRDIVELPFSIWDYWKWMLIPLLLLIIWWIYIRFRRGPQPDIVVAPAIPFVPAHVKAIRALEDLRSEELWQHGDQDGYHTKLTHIMRRYIQDRFEIQSLEMVSSEIADALRKSNMDYELVSKVENLLNIADLVKFAKATGTDSVNHQALVDAFEFVELTKQETI